MTTVILLLAFVRTNFSSTVLDNIHNCDLVWYSYIYG